MSVKLTMKGKEASEGDPMSHSNMTIDASARPDLFDWNGQMEQEQFELWLAKNEWIGACPKDLLDFWQATGGGDVFETETILGPLSDPSMGDDLEAVNSEMRARGMPARFLVFHVGLVTSAADVQSGDYVELAENGFGVKRRFASFDEWYRETLRAEYSQRYGLP